MRHVNIVLMGPPGSGKGTQAARIAQRYDVPIISTGDILRSAARSGSPMGLAARTTMTAGGLVDDETMVGLVRERLGQTDTAPGFILDGFPRTVVQAQALDRLLEDRPVLALALTVPEAELERRLDQRRICLKCRAVYTGGTRHGSEEEHCARCGVALIKRDDDNLETIKNRLQTYRQTTAPVLAHYAQRGVLAAIDGTQSTDAVAHAIADKIDRARTRSNGA